MRYTRIKLTGFAGIKNGLYLDEIEIDLNKCQHNILLLVGDTGSGKSTIMNALNPMPDDNSKFIPNVPACKELDIDNTYFLKIYYGVKSNGNRDTPKVYFHKINGNDELVDLNPNLNVTSYKEVLYNELGLDANYLALSKLGQRCNSIVSMTPGERKKFINSIITELTDYNDIYKTLSKRSTIFKSFINNTNNKISNIGDREYLTNSLIGIEERLNKAMNEKDLIVEELAKYKSIIQMNDPDGSIQESYNTLYNSLIGLNNDKKTVANNIVQICNQYNFDLKDLTGLYTKTQQEISDCNIELKILENNNMTLLSNRDSKFTELQKHQMEISSLQSDYNFQQLENEIQQLTTQCSSYEDIIKKNSIEDKGYTIESLSSIINILSDIANSFRLIRENYQFDIIQSIDNLSNIDYDKEISIIENRLSVISNEVTRYNTLLEIVKVLDKRPNECKVDSCPFIKNAVEALAENPYDNITRLEQEKSELNLKLQSLYNDKVKNMNILRCKSDIDICNRMISSYKNQLDSVKIIIDTKDYLTRGYMLENEFELINKYIEECNILTIYETCKFKLEKLSVQYQQIQSKKEMIQYIEKSIKVLTEDLNGIDIKIADNSNNTTKLKQELNIKSTLLQQIQSVLTYKQEYDKIENSINDINSKMFTLQSSMQIIQQHISLIEQTNLKLDNINKEIKPLIEDRDTIKHSLRLLEGYLAELEEYNNKYTKVELIKKHCSPTKGIGLAFMALYLNSTLNIANTLMDIVFEGEYSLLPFNIDENEFKIPCIGGALPHDDVSSTSGGQESIISMILSFSILHQSATKFNIFQLDEVDAPLDTNNRRRFVQVINKMIDELGLEQVIMISHNREIPYNYVDTIILKTSEEFNEGNIVYKY